MPPKRNASASRSRSRSRSRGGRKARSTSRSASRSRGRRAPAAASPAAVAAQPLASTPIFNDPKAPMPDSMWEADAKLMDAMSSGRSHVRSTGVRKLFRGPKSRVWGYWAAIIAFQVIAIVWVKWTIDMYKQYRSKVH
jgi:hypothetical protein